MRLIEGGLRWVAEGTHRVVPQCMGSNGLFFAYSFPGGYCSLLHCFESISKSISTIRKNFDYVQTDRDSSNADLKSPQPLFDSLPGNFGKLRA